MISDRVLSVYIYAHGLFLITDSFECQSADVGNGFDFVLAEFSGLHFIMLVLAVIRVAKISIVKFFVFISVFLSEECLLGESEFVHHFFDIVLYVFLNVFRILCSY